MKILKKVLVVYKKSIYELYQQSNDHLLRSFMGSNHDDVIQMKESHFRQKASLEKVRSILHEHNISYDDEYRGELAKNVKENNNYICSYDLVITVGGDGTFLDVSHYVCDVPILGVNADPQTSTGFFCMFDKDSIGDALLSFDSVQTTTLTRIKITVDNKPLSYLALNDVFFSHSSPVHGSAYSFEVENKPKETITKSSGFLVSTAAGSSAWIKNMGGEVMTLDNTSLQYLVRDIPKKTCGFSDTMITLFSLTRCGTLYIDGSALEVEAPIGTSILLEKGEPLLVVGDLNKKRE